MNATADETNDRNLRQETIFERLGEIFFPCYCVIVEQERCGEQRTETFYVSDCGLGERLLLSRVKLPNI